MGGKRPDQHNIAPGEAGASDYKTLPESGKHRGSVDGTTIEDKQHVAEGMGHGGGPGQHFFDPAEKQPSHDSGVHALEGHSHGGDDSEMSAESPREREAEGTEDPRDRGVGA
jgi:hypothetical protein